MRNIPALPDEAAFGIADADGAAWKIKNLTDLLSLDDVMNDKDFIIFITGEIEEATESIRKNLTRIVAALRTEDVTLEAA